MKNIKFKIIGIFVATVVAISLSSCEEAADAVCDIDNETNSYLSASQSFSRNPTRSTCNTLKSRAESFLDAAENCGGVDTSAAQRIWNEIDCSDF